jgi:hypothetical protein
VNAEVSASINTYLKDFKQSINIHGIRQVIDVVIDNVCVVGSVYNVVCIDSQIDCWEFEIDVQQTANETQFCSAQRYAGAIAVRAFLLNDDTLSLFYCRID